MKNFKEFRKKNTQMMRPYIPGENLSGVSVSSEDTPETGGMIAINPNNESDKWYIAKKFFEENYESVEVIHEDGSGKTLHNSEVSGAKKNVPDLIVYGDGDLFKLIAKASSKKEGWMKSTKGMDVGTGVVVQVTTQQGDNVAEALCFIPGARLEGNAKDGWKIV